VKLWLVAVLCFATEAAGQSLTITFLDVGQGDAALIRSPTGRNVLVDAGPNPTRLAEWLRRNRVDTIHLAIASHNHADHIGGMPKVLETVPVRNYMENGMVATTRTYARILTLLEEGRIPVLRAEPRRIDLGGGASLRVLSSVPKPRTQNDASIGLALTYGRFSVLFTGDAEERQRAFWARDSVGQVRVLKVSHHGSINGTDASWLSTLRPCAAVISVGAKNSFNHPARKVERLLDSARVATYRTDRVGEVVIRADSVGSFQLATGRPSGVTKFNRPC
jgi:competence protein ComEC